MELDLYWTTVIAAGLVAVLMIRDRSRESFATKTSPKTTTKTAPKKNPSMTFTQVPVARSYTFATPLNANANDLDKALAKATNASIPVNVVDGSGEPIPTPYADAEVMDIAKTALARAGIPTLQLVSIEFATKHVDKLGNAQYGIVLFAYDGLRSFGAKISCVALKTKSGTVYVKTLESFNRPPTTAGPEGTANFAGQESPFINDLGIDFVKLYG